MKDIYRVMKKTVGVIQEGFSEEVLYEMNLKMRRSHKELWAKSILGQCCSNRTFCDDGNAVSLCCDTECLKYGLWNCS